MHNLSSLHAFAVLNSRANKLLFGVVFGRDYPLTRFRFPLRFSNLCGGEVKQQNTSLQNEKQNF
jgi:hypothetical protein